MKSSFFCHKIMKYICISSQATEPRNSMLKRLRAVLLRQKQIMNALDLSVVYASYYIKDAIIDGMLKEDEEEEEEDTV